MTTKKKIKIVKPKGKFVDAQPEPITRAEFDAIKPGDFVKAFIGRDNMWWIVRARDGETLIVELNNEPVFPEESGLSIGDHVKIQRRHVMGHAGPTLKQRAKKAYAGVKKTAKKQYRRAKKAVTAAMKNPNKFSPGDIVRYTTKFMRSVGIVTRPEDGIVVGHSGLTSTWRTDKGDVSFYPIVAWSDGRPPTAIHEANIELDKGRMAKSTAEYRQSVVDSIRREYGPDDKFEENLAAARDAYYASATTKSSKKKAKRNQTTGTAESPAARKQRLMR